jgi:hypothetical protein
MIVPDQIDLLTVHDPAKEMIPFPKFLSKFPDAQDERIDLAAKSMLSARQRRRHSGQSEIVVLREDKHVHVTRLALFAARK